MADTFPPGVTGTGGARRRCGGMDGERAIWLVRNAASGSNGDAALAALEACCNANGLCVAHRTVFPAQDLPTAAMLDAAGITLVAAFAGDGTINTLLGKLAGWSGSVLVLPGGTMNLLYHRLHGESSIDATIAAVARGAARLCRPSVISTRSGTAYAGLLAGPGTSWGRVREAMREGALAEFAETTVDAIDETLTGEMIRCDRPAVGRREGYPLVRLEPDGDSIAVFAYHAETAAEYLEQTWALLRRSFREGPHELLGRAGTVRLASTCGNTFGLLIDGEQAHASPETEFVLAAAEVDLVATRSDGS